MWQDAIQTITITAAVLISMYLAVLGYLAYREHKLFRKIDLKTKQCKNCGQLFEKYELPEDFVTTSEFWDTINGVDKIDPNCSCHRQINPYDNYSGD